MRPLILFWTDAALFLLFLAMLATGLLQRYSPWDVGDLHFWISLAFLAPLALHLAMHWAFLKTTLPRYLLRRPRRA